MSIFLSTPNISKREINAILKTIKKGWFSMGPQTRYFEEEFATYVGARYAIAVNSCTSALFLSLKALGIGSGDEVIVPSFTFAATANVVVHCGAKPVFVDISPDDYTMDQKSFEKAITKKTKAVIPVHYAGNRAHIETNIPIIEDSAHLIPKAGDNISTYTRCYSFYTTKNITTIDGGMVTTNSSQVNEWLRKARLHGLSSDAWKRYDLKSRWVYGVEFSGYKMNMTDLASTIGRVQLKRLEKFEVKRRKVVSLYNKLLGLNNKGTHLYPILVENREKFFEYMKKNHIGCSFHFPALHMEPAFRYYSKRTLPVTEYVAQRVATLPLDAVITKGDVTKVATLINKFLKRQ